MQPMAVRQEKRMLLKLEAVPFQQAGRAGIMQTELDHRLAEGNQKLIQVMKPLREGRTRTVLHHHSAGQKRLTPVQKRQQAGFAQREPRPRRTSALALRVQARKQQRTSAANSEQTAAGDWVAPTDEPEAVPGLDCQKWQVQPLPPTCW